MPYKIHLIELRVKLYFRKILYKTKRRPDTSANGALRHAFF